MTATSKFLLASLDRFSPAGKALIVQAQAIADEKTHAQITLLHLLAAALELRPTRTTADWVGADIDAAETELEAAFLLLPTSDEPSFMDDDALVLLARVEVFIDREVTYPDLLAALVNAGDWLGDAEAAQTFRRIVAQGRLRRLGMRSPEPTSIEPILATLDGDDRLAFEALVDALDDPPSIHRATWEEKGLFVGAEVGVRIIVGPGSSPSVTRAVARHETTTTRKFPPLLAAWLAYVDGMDVVAIGWDRNRAYELAQPEIDNGLLHAALLAPGTTRDGAITGLEFARAHDQVFLLVEGGEHDGKVVYDAPEGPVVVASSLAALVRAVIEHGLSFAAVVAATR